ncbi:hypothetical protein IC229_04460 [Spirosoma sp. BT702]|uniref:T9SS type A sorting domain-containing protein n=1 Tax=Spirosoma profusum TaxID=2771354 RepID=A0A926Y0U3_9BACT|nr:hypothetical protein [Spirosoma profusum]MBD2699875.1 hypothetical protein [Spirosoma profusum]
MKTLIKSFALALSLGIVTASATLTEAKPIGIKDPSSAVSYQTGIYTSKDNKLNIALNKELGGTVDVKFKNNEGTVLFSERLGKNETAYRTRLNLGELPDGVYQVEITNGVETQKHVVTIKTEQPATSGRVVAMN